jgi:hypothetical protein
MQHSTIMVDFSPNGRSNFLRKREALAVAIAERQDPCLVQTPGAE